MSADLVQADQQRKHLTADITHDLSTLTQVEGGGLVMQLQPVTPLAQLERIYYAYQPIAACQGVELRLEVPGGISPILVDEGRMLQV